MELSRHCPNCHRKLDLIQRWHCLQHLIYWYQILPDLARNGSTVFAAQISPLESTEVRGEQLLTQVEEIRALTGKDKVNLIIFYLQKSI